MPHGSLSQYVYGSECFISRTGPRTLMLYVCFPTQSLLLGAQVPPASPISPTATSPTARQFQGLPFTGGTSPPPRVLTSPVGSLARTSTERQPRSETAQAALAAHPRGPPYDRILEVRSFSLPVFTSSYLNGLTVFAFRLPLVSHRTETTWCS